MGSRGGHRPGFFESFWWSDPDALVSSFARFRFELRGRNSFDYPWKGEQLWFEAQ